MPVIPEFMHRFRKWLPLAFLILAIGTITLGLQTSVGNSTLYAKDLEEKREALHYGILNNRPPDGERWGATGAATTNIRVGSVYLAQGIIKLTGWRPARAYFLIDTVFLFTALFALFFYLRRWLPDTYCLIGVLYFSAIMPMTYYHHYFHPWDRIQLVLWLLLFYLVRERRPLAIAPVVALSMTVKFDTLVVPGFYWLAHLSRERWARVTLESLALGVVVYLTFTGLHWMFPAEVATERLALREDALVVFRNLQQWRNVGIAWPPLYFHGLLVPLVFVGFRSRERFVQASAVFGIGILMLVFYSVNFMEVRAQTMVTVLLLPAALLALRDLLERRGDRRQINTDTRRQNAGRL